jgi:hypothetical protein
VFYWLDRATSGAGLKCWLKDVPGLDLSTLNDVTPHYVAKPLFVGVADPVPVRSKLIAGVVDAVEVCIPPEPARPRPAPEPRRAPPAAGARPYVGTVCGGRFSVADAYLLACLKGLARTPPGQGRAALTRIALRLFGLCKAGLLDPEAVAGRLKGAMLSRGWGADEAQRGMTLADVNRQLEWCWQHAEARGLRS